MKILLSAVMKDVRPLRSVGLLSVHALVLPLFYCLTFRIKVASVSISDPLKNIIELDILMNKEQTVFYFTASK